MKKHLFTILFFAPYLLVAQANKVELTSVEDRIYGVQVSLGAWTYGEFKLDKTITLRAEIGLEGGIYNHNDFFYKSKKTNFILYPAVSVSPRWYYSLHKRQMKGKKTAGNSANFLSLNLTFNPNWFEITNDPYAKKYGNAIQLIPSWGMRRSIGKHFDFELGLGMGYSYNFIVKPNFQDEHDFIAKLHLRFGYYFSAFSKK